MIEGDLDTLEERGTFGSGLSAFLLSFFFVLFLVMIPVHAKAEAPNRDEPYALPKNIVSGVNVFF